MSERVSEEAAMRSLYGPVVIPPCRICGSKMEIGRCGGGETTLWYCSTALKDGRDDAAWKHFDDSQFTDVNAGGDERVIKALDELDGCRAERDALRQRLSEAEAARKPLVEALRRYAIQVDRMSYHSDDLMCELCGSTWNDGSYRKERATPEPDCFAALSSVQRGESGK